MKIKQIIGEAIPLDQLRAMGSPESQASKDIATRLKQSLPVRANTSTDKKAIKPLVPGKTMPVPEEMPSTTGNDQEGTIVASDDKSVTVQMPDGTQIKKDLLGAITQDAQGNDVFNMTTQPASPTNPTTQQTPQQRLQAGTKIAISNQAPQQTMGAPARPMGENLAISEDGGVYPVNTKTNPPTVMDNGNTSRSALGTTKSGEEITPELIARSTDWQERKIQANGKIYTALYSGTRGYVVGKQTYQAIIGNTSSTPSNLKEADNILLDKMLTIARLR